MPTLAGLIATMPLTGLIVFIWIYLDNKDNYVILQKYTRGALWGILPSILFFLTSYFLLKKQFSFPIIITISLCVWGLGAFIHQWLLR